ncbi:MAG: type II toxin-antitoxin system RelE/ParE family toxin, partial [Candidatus Scalindua sp.]
NKAGIKSSHNKKLRIQLTALNTATCIEDMDLPGFRLHPLKGNRKGLWATDVSKNWRIVFKFEEDNVYVVDYEDYH